MAKRTAKVKTKPERLKKQALTSSNGSSTPSASKSRGTTQREALTALNVRQKARKRALDPQAPQSGGGSGSGGNKGDQGEPIQGA